MLCQCKVWGAQLSPGHTTGPQTLTPRLLFSSERKWGKKRGEVGRWSYDVTARSEGHEWGQGGTRGRRTYWVVPAASAGVPGVAISHVVLVLRETMRCEDQHQHHHQGHGTTTRHGTPQHTGPTLPEGMGYQHNMAHGTYTHHGPLKHTRPTFAVFMALQTPGLFYQHKPTLAHGTYISHLSLPNQKLFTAPYTPWASHQHSASSATTTEGHGHTQARNPYTASPNMYSMAFFPGPLGLSRGGTWPGEGSGTAPHAWCSFTSHGSWVAGFGAEPGRVCVDLMWAREWWGWDGQVWEEWRELIIMPV